MSEFSQDRIKYDTCPLCDEGSFPHVFTGHSAKHELHERKLDPHIKWIKCNSCDHVFTEGYHTKEASEVIFSKKGDNLKVGRNLEKNRLISAKMIEKVLPYADSGIWLDVGFGNASLLFTAREFGFRPIGVDLRIENVEALRRLGIEAYCANLEKLEIDQNCTVISFMDVLEHIPYPGDALAAAQKMLKKDGVIFVSMPNSESIVWDALNRSNSNPYWGEIEHYHNFSRARLYSFLQAYGFKPVRYGVSERYRVCMEVVALKT